MAKLFSDGMINELEIIAYEQEDVEKLISYMVQGNDKRM
jgi:hypothetical protein